jgi:hypothetical protein
MGDLQLRRLDPLLLMDCHEHLLCGRSRRPGEPNRVETNSDCPIMRLANVHSLM